MYSLLGPLGTCTLIKSITQLNMMLLVRVFSSSLLFFMLILKLFFFNYLWGRPVCVKQTERS